MKGREKLFFRAGDNLETTDIQQHYNLCSYQQKVLLEIKIVRNPIVGRWKPHNWRGFATPKKEFFSL